MPEQKANLVRSDRLDAGLHRRAGAYRRSWPYLRAPLGVYVMIMVPICLLELFLLLTRSPAWMRGSAGAVVLISAAALFRGYVRRLVLSPQGARMAGIGRGVLLPWSHVRRVGVYVPGGGLGATEYVYITTRDACPRGKWDIDDQTIQLQNRAGLLEAVRAAGGLRSDREDV